MQRNLAIALVASLSGEALANYCNAGQKHKDNLANLHCIMNTEDAPSCAAECCESDPKKCAGREPAPVCASDHYFGSDFASKHTAVPTGTSAEANKVCCKPRAKCSEAQCPAGYKQNTANANLLCSSNAASCIQNTLCCTKDDKTCGGTDYKPAAGDITADVDHYFPDGDQQTDTWKRTVVVPDADAAKNAAAVKKACQIKKATCKDATYTCPAGLVKPPAKATPNRQLSAGAAPAEGTKCPSDDTSCIAACCVAPAAADTTQTCGGFVLPEVAAGNPSYFAAAGLVAFPGGCGAKTFTPPQADLGKWANNKVTDQKAYAKAWAAKTTTTKNKVTDCCLPQPTCTSHTCPAGKKTKTGLAAGALCANTASCTTDCCEDDVTTCGGIAATTGIVCKYGFFNEMDSWGLKTTQSVKDVFNAKVASKANASTVCCTARVACAIPGTSTPAPAVVTTTPAAAALKYSEHNIAVEGSQSSGVNMLWLGAGAVVGMGVLMVVQGLRSKSQAADQTEDSDADMLLDSRVE